MNIKEIRVEGLFGMFDHTISLQDDGLTIIYGMNGVGKTMIFRMLEHLFNADFVGLSEIPFEKLEIELKDEYFISITKKVEGIIFHHYSMSYSMEFRFNYDVNDLRTKLEKHYPNKFNFRDKENDFFLLHPFNGKNEILRNHNFLKLLPEYLPNNLKVQEHPFYLKEDENEEELYIDDITNVLNKYKFNLIGTQRLLAIQTIDEANDQNPSLEKRVQVLEEIQPKYGAFGQGYLRSMRSGFSFSKQKKETVNNFFNVEEYENKYSKQLSNLIKSKHDEYQKLSEALELSLGKRLIEKKIKTDYTTEELKQELASVEKRLEELRSVGLLAGQKIEQITIDETVDSLSKAVISVNVQDIKSKLTIFDELYKKLRLFLDIINNRRFSYKKLIISEANGFSFENAKQVQLTPDELSSGEKHELILIYQLLFVIPEDSMVMIDEPEISLHISWQKEFVNDMLEIIKLRNINIVAATHSPSIINGNWDLTVSLKGLEEETHA